MPRISTARRGWMRYAPRWRLICAMMTSFEWRLSDVNWQAPPSTYLARMISVHSAVTIKITAHALIHQESRHYAGGDTWRRRPGICASECRMPSPEAKRRQRID
ncbi:hypothetical protein KCP70_23780 [Salmonella enterica subsp. enterica]|nr:hypothetical protein KCP70_23780 [Salmonella enterica subsp. enterica]